MHKCLSCNGELAPYVPPGKEQKDLKETYLSCTVCGSIHAKIKIPNYKTTK